MQTLHKSEFYEILFDKNKSLIVHKALEGTSEMSDENFKKEMVSFAEACDKYKPTKDLVNLVDMRYSIVPEVQEWVNTEVFPTIMSTIRQMALVMPSSIFESVAIEQTMEEEIGKNFNQKYFDNEKKALEWLMN